MIRHAEEQPYAERIWAWMPCDGWPQEWFHWGEYLLDGLEDYSPAAHADFQRWLRNTYQDDEEKLQAAWGRQVTFAEARIPEPWERACTSHGEFYDPIRDRPTIDYTQCISDSMVDTIVALCQAGKDAMREPKVICTWYGYPFCHLPRPQLAAAAQLHLPVDLHPTARDHLLGFTAAGGQPGGLEQGVERDVLATQLEVDAPHPAVLRLSRPAHSRLAFTVFPLTFPAFSPRTASRASSRSTAT